MASSHWICLALLLWHVTCYIATAVATAHVAIPSLAQSLGLLTFKQGSSAVTYLLAQLAAAMMLAALSRADLYLNDPEHAPSCMVSPQLWGPLGPLPTLHDSIANYWHHGRRHSLSHDHSKHTGGPDRSSGGADSAAEVHSPQGGEGGLSPIRTRVGQAAPSGQRPASLVSCMLTHHCYYTHCCVQELMFKSLFSKWHSAKHLIEDVDLLMSVGTAPTLQCVHFPWQCFYNHNVFSPLHACPIVRPIILPDSLS